MLTASALAALAAFAPVAAAQDRNADASSFEASVALIRPTVQPTDPGDVSTDVAPADLLRPIEPDHRLEQDRNAFDDPPAGYDPRRFRIEPVPREDRRIREFFEIEPYAPLGWRLGSFILYSELEVGGGWDSNVFYQPSARSDWLAELDCETRLVTDWDNHALEFRVRNGAGFYRDFTDQGDAQSTYAFRGRLDVLRSTNLEIVAGHDLVREDANAMALFRLNVEFPVNRWRWPGSAEV